MGVRVSNANQKAANATWIESVAARNVLQRMWHLHIARETYSANVDKKKIKKTLYKIIMKFLMP